MKAADPKQLTIVYTKYLTLPMDPFVTKYFLVIEPHNRKLPIANRTPGIKADWIVASCRWTRELYVTGSKCVFGNYLVSEYGNIQLINVTRAHIAKDGYFSNCQRRESVASQE